jgi:hypothetical protein
MQTAEPEQAENAAQAEPEVIETQAEAPAQAGAEVTDGEINFDELTPAEIQAHLYEGKPLEIAAKAESEPEPEVTTTPTPETAPVAEVAPKPAVPEVENLDEPLPGRISPKQFASDEQKAMRLQHVLNDGKKPGDPGFVSLWEAKAQLDARDGKATTPPATPDPVEAINSAVSELDTNLKALREQKREAIANGEEVAEIEEKIEAARDAIQEQKVKLAIAEDRAQRQQAQEAATKAQTAQQQLASTKAEVLKEFPDINNLETPFGATAGEVIADLADHPAMQTPEAPEFVKNEALKRIAKKDGITFAQAVLKYSAPPAAPVAPKAAPVTKPAAPAVRKVLPAVGSQTTTPPKAAPTAEEMLAQAESDPLAAERFLYGNRKISALR